MFRFNLEKSLQAVVAMLHTETSQRMNYMRLLKVLYICDKESLAEIGRPITGDKVVAMERGPVLNHLYDLIMGKYFCCDVWDQFIARDGFNIFIKKMPSLDLLNKFELEKINEIAERYRLFDEWDMVKLTHTFQEWQKNDPGNSSKPIPFDDILEAINRMDDADSIKKEAAFEKHLAAMFEG